MFILLKCSLSIIFKSLFLLKGNLEVKAYGTQNSQGSWLLFILFHPFPISLTLIDDLYKCWWFICWCDPNPHFKKSEYVAYICFFSQSCCIYPFTSTNGKEKNRRHPSKLFEVLIYLLSANGVQQLYLLLLISFCCLCLDGISSNLSFGLVNTFSELSHKRFLLFHFLLQPLSQVSDLHHGLKDSSSYSRSLLLLPFIVITLSKYYAVFTLPWLFLPRGHKLTEWLCVGKTRSHENFRFPFKK